MFENKHILIVEDIIDTGATLLKINETLNLKGCCKSFQICALVKRPQKQYKIAPTWSGF